MRLWKGNLILQVLSKSSRSTSLMNLQLSGFCEPLLQGHWNSVHQSPMADWEIFERYHPFNCQFLPSTSFLALVDQHCCLSLVYLKIIKKSNPPKPNQPNQPPNPKKQTENSHTWHTWYQELWTICVEASGFWFVSVGGGGWGGVLS